MNDDTALNLFLVFLIGLGLFIGIVIGTRLDGTISQIELQEINKACEVYTIDVDHTYITVNCKDGTTKEIK